MNDRILTIGGVYSVTHTFFPTLPSVGGESVGTNYYVYPGGATASASLAIARYGSSCILCSKVGDDREGERLKAFLTSEGIDTRFVECVQRGKTGIIISMNEEDGGRRSLRFPACSDTLSKEDIENAFTSYPDALYITSSLPDELVLYAASEAKRQDIPIYYQPCRSKPSLHPRLLPHLEVFILDEDEVYNYCGMGVELYEKCLPACIALSRLYDARYYVIRMSERGAFIYDGMYHEIISPFPTSGIDTAAGREVFGAVLCADHIKTDNIRQAACIANAAASLAMGKRGDVQSVPTLRAITELIENSGVSLS